MASSELMASSDSRKSDPPSSPQFTPSNFISDSRTVDDVWREIVAGARTDFKEEAPDEMMTLEDFLVKAGAVDGEDDDDIKMPLPLTDNRLSGGSVFSFDPVLQGLDSVDTSVVESGAVRGKRGRPMLEQLDKAAQQRQRRMIKNRESAARSRERKQAYQVELESLAVKLEEENDKLLKEKGVVALDFSCYTAKGERGE